MSGSVKHYYFSDHVGSHSVVTGVTGACEQDIDYYPYGGVEQDYCGSVPQKYKFSGKERDSESGLDNFGARYNASSLGRFMTPDWSERATTVPYAVFGDPQSLNLYSYVRNDPVSRADADGHDPGDNFVTKNAAAADAVGYMRKQENGYKWEYGTRIQKNGKNYSYSPPVTQKNPKVSIYPR